MGWQDIYKKKMQESGLAAGDINFVDVDTFHKREKERWASEVATGSVQTVTAPAKQKKEKYVASPYGTFLGGFSYKGNTRRQKSEQELADEAAQQAAYIKEYQRLAGLDLDSYGKQVESAKKAAQNNRTQYNVRAFGGYDASRMTDEERTYAAMQADYNKAKDIQYDIKGQAALENLTAEQSKAVETLATERSDTAKRQTAWTALQKTGLSDDDIAQLVNYQRNIPKRQKNAERYAEMQDAAEAYAETNPGLATIASVPANLLSGIGTFDAAMRKMSDPDSPVDYKSGAFLPYAYSRGVRDTVTKNLESDYGKGASFAYGVGTSMLDSAATVGLAALGIPAGVASATLGGAAATSAMTEAKARGLSDEKAILTGVLSGVAETAFEKFSLESLISMKLPTGTAKQRVVGALKNAAAQAGIEGSEEMFTDFANLIFDSAVNGSMSDVQQRIAVYMAGGMDYDEARKKVLGETVKDVALDFVAGGLAGGLMGGGNMALQTAAHGAYDARVNDARMAVRQRAGVTGSYQAAEDGKTSYNGQETSVRSVVKDGKVELTTGETVDPKDVQFSDRNTADLYEGAIRTAENAGAAQVFVDSYTGGDVSTYILGMQEAYHNGKEGVPLEDAGGFAADLSDAQRRAAWEQGRAAASVPDLKDYGFGEKGTQAWNKVQENEAVRNNRRLRAGFTAMYQAGMRGESASAVKSDAAKYIPPSVQTAAYQAGLADAAESLARETAAVQFVSSAGSESGLVDNEYARKLAEEKSGTAALLSMLGKDLGVRVEIVPKVLGGNANGQYVAGRNLVQIAADADNAFEFVAAHEVTHRMQSLAPEEYRSYRDYAMRFRAQELGEEGAVALVERYRAMAEEAGVKLTQEEAMDEIAADFTMRMIEDGGLFEDFARENRSEAGKLLDALKAFIAKVKALFRGKEARDNAAREAYGTDMATLEECVARWQKAYDAAGKQAQRVRVSDAVQQGDTLQYDDAVYSLRVTDKDTLDFLNGQKTIKTYKTMQIVDGKLYPPMAARVDGKYEDASELGKWEMAVERPDLVKDGKFKLDKGKGQGSLTAAYNPYMHSSNLVINDQFSGAYTRNNLVTVECEVPVSEMTSGYHADGAKDGVGWHSWHTGTVAGQIRRASGTERKVFLSRWIKPVRILPDAEVAVMYKDLLGDTGIAVPDNVVTPSLLKELRKVGVAISESGRVKTKTAAGEGSGNGRYIEKKKVISAAPFSAETHSEVFAPKPSVNSIPTSDGNVNAKFSLKGMDSAGRQLSEQQQEYFKDSKVRDAEGRLMPLYHQTDAEFTVFDTRHKGAGTGDNETPFGVFLKKSSKDIGVKGNRQMELYANIKNPLQVRDRSELVFHLARMSPEYEALKAKSDVVDKEYGRKFEKAKKDFVDFIAEWRRQNPNASRSALYEVDEFNRFFDAEDNIVEEWGKVKDELALQAKETITAALRNNGYDGVIISEDSGSFGRTTDAYIALDANQVKRTDNLNPTSDPDIRFQLKSARELEQEVRELKKYAAYRKRGTSDREILTSTADSSAQTEWERKRLAEYKDVMGRLETYERRLSENKAKLEELAFLGDKKNARRISQLKTEITQDTNRIGIVENKLGELENTRSLKTLLDREKAIIHQQEGEYLRKVEELMGGYRDLYGTMAKGEKAARDIQMPKKTSENEKISQTVRTILEAKATPDEMVPTIEEMALNGEYSYEVYSDKNAISDAEEEIKRVGWAQSLSEWTKAVQKGEVSKKNTAMGWALYNNAANSGDTGTALTILSNMVEHQRSAAQALQATRILKSLSPETQLYQAQRSVDNLQTGLNKRYGDKKAPELKIDPALAEQFMQAADQETRDAVLRNIYRDIGKQMPSRFGDKWNAWRYLAMLGNARTHVRNVVGNAGFAPVVAAKNAVATGIEKAVYRLSDGKMERSKEFVFGKDGKALLKAAAQDYAKVQDVAMGGGKYSDLANANKYIEEGRVIFQSKVPVLKQVSKGLEAARKANSKALDAEDVWFSKPHYAYAMAQYCKANGITPQMIEAGKGIEKAREYAIREAQKATYRDTNSFSQAISELGRTVKPGSNGTRKAVAVAMEGILPFRKTPANILVRGVEYSPIGLMNGIKQALFDVRKGTKTAAEAIDSISAGLTGTGLLGLGLFLAAQGLVRGHGSDDDDKNAYAELTGHQAYALELPDGTSITLDWLAPECLPFFIGVNLWEITDGGKEILTMSDALNAVTMVSEPLLEMSCLQSLNDVFDAVGYASSNGLSGLPTALANAATSYLTQGLPTILGQAERAGENIRYATYTDKNSVLTSDMQYAIGRASAKIPGLDYSQIPYIDAWGRREITGNLGERLLNNFLNPAYVSDVSESEMEKELMRLYEATGESGVLPSRAGKSFSANKEKINLTGEQYVKYAEKRGGEAYKWMTALTQNNAYRSMSDEEKADCVKYIYEAANEVAKSGIVGSSYEMKTWVKDAVGGAGVVETAIAKTKYADVSQKAVNAYKAFSGSIGEDVFLKTWDALGDITGEDYDGDGRSDAYSKIDKKLEYINGLNLTAQQKRALAIANGIKEKTVDKRAPW